MPPEPPPSDSAADRRRHDLSTTLTHMRLQTQLLLRLAHRPDGPDRGRLIQGLTRIDEGISTLVRQLDHREER